MVKSFRINTRKLARTDWELRMAQAGRMEIDWLIHKLDYEKIVFQLAIHIICCTFTESVKIISFYAL